jgi:pimeloyl-ACP methyl ester carboxylesterase
MIVAGHSRLYCRVVFLTALVAGVLGASALAQDVQDEQDEVAPGHRAVKAVGDARIRLAGGGVLPLYLTADWSRPLPYITRAVIVVHGLQRNADNYFETAMRAQAAAGAIGGSTLMIVPQFLTQIDIDAHRLPADTLRWSRGGWESGEPAHGPAPTSSFEAFDAILARLADRRLFSRLAGVVLAGHSGGGQVVQRYAIAGRGDAALLRAGIAVRYVVANPSSYAYFSGDRPVPAVAASCPRYNDWKYGMARLPPYLANRAPADLERSYVARQVIYLLGTQDIDPNHQELDKTCMGEAQGPYRYARGRAYADYMKARDRGTPNHVVLDVPGVTHSARKMLTSPCGLTALFDLPGCVGPR